MAFLIVALFLSVAVNFYYYSTATSLNQDLRSDIGYRVSERDDSPLDVLEISRTQPILDLYIREAVRIQDENEEMSKDLRNALRENDQLRTDFQQMRTNLQQVRTELTNAQQSGGIDDLATLFQLLIGF